MSASYRYPGDEATRSDLQRVELELREEVRKVRSELSIHKMNAQMAWGLAAYVWLMTVFLFLLSRI